MIRFVLMIALVGVVLAGALALPIDIPYTVSTVGKVLPAAEWMLVRDDEGSIGTRLQDHREGTLRSANIHKFDRGDAVRYHMNPAMRARARVSAGDTVLQIHSNETARQFAVATGEMAAAQSAVSLYASGEKDALVAREEQSLARALELVEQQGRTLERLRALRERELVSEQELEIAASQLEIFQAEADMARADLNVVRTGAKPEQLHLARAETQARRLEMEALAERLTMQTIRSPISGVAVRSFGSDTLLTIRDTSTAIVVMPIAWRDVGTLKLNQTVRMELDQSAREITGRIIEIGDSVERLGTEQVVLVTALIGEMPEEILAGGVIRCRIETDPVRLFEYVRRKVL